MAFSAQLLLSSSSGYSRNRVSRVAASAPEFVGMLSSPQSTKKAGRRTGGDGETLTVLSSISSGVELDQRRRRFGKRLSHNRFSVPAIVNRVVGQVASHPIQMRNAIVTNAANLIVYPLEFFRFTAARAIFLRGILHQIHHTSMSVYGIGRRHCTGSQSLCSRVS